jgi:hypothetical protein
MKIRHSNKRKTWHARKKYNITMQMVLVARHEAPARMLLKTQVSLVGGSLTTFQRVMVPSSSGSSNPEDCLTLMKEAP